MDFQRPIDYFLNAAFSADRFLTTNLASVERFIVQSIFPPTSYSSPSFLKLHTLNSVRSPLSFNFPLMNPFHVALFVLGYLSIIFLGKQFMANRTRFALKTFALLHNFAMVSLSAFMCFEVVRQAILGNYSAVFDIAHDPSPAGLPMARIVWLFYLSKIFEFVDTFIMVFKKNNRQISFLHVYHHGSIFVIWWLVTFAAPNGSAYYSAALNSFIHVIMYGYYFLAAIGVKQVTFVKKYITSSQMIQFCLNMVQATFNIYNAFAKPNAPHYPVELSILLWGYMVTMLALFANFYRSDRMREKKFKKQ